MVRKLEDLESINTEEDIYEIAGQVEDKEREQAIMDVFLLLRQDKRVDANNRLKLFLGELKPVSELAEKEVTALADGESIKSLDAEDPRFKKVFEHFVKTAGYMDWMLFLHPEQNHVVERDFSGPAKLVGVSGSGKTCILVKRAIRLAEKYRNEKILILTLNRQLSSLIKDMVDAACMDELRSNIDVKPFSSLCQEYLRELEPDNERLYDDVTWKSREHIDEIWREYYRCELNNHDAEVFVPLHDSLISRNVNAEQYIREELDWIRSAVITGNREDYLKMERKGRTYPLDERYRKIILQGLEFWERKMYHVGVIDYLGLSTALHKHIEKVTPAYRCILIDESRDFGAIEYRLIRSMCAGNANDLFFCGDAAQQGSSTGGI